MKELSIKDLFIAQTDELGDECSVIRCFKSRHRVYDSVDYIVRTGVDTDRFCDLSEEEQRKVITWIRGNVKPCPRPCHRLSSYGMKHVLEHRTNIYVTNNQFKEAMLQCGFYPEKVDELNWYFYVCPLSPVFVEQEDGRDGLLMPECVMKYARAH